MFGFVFLWSGGPNDSFDPLLLLIACVSIAVGFVWRCSRAVQFHVCFWSGIGIFAATLPLVLHAVAIFRAGEPRVQMYAAPCFIVFAVLLGLVLLMSALCLDRAALRAN